MLLVALYCFKHYRIRSGSLVLYYSAENCSFVEGNNFTASYVYVQGKQREDASRPFARANQEFPLNPLYGKKVAAVYVASDAVGYAVPEYNPWLPITIAFGAFAALALLCFMLYVLLLYRKQQRLDRIKKDQQYISLRSEGTSQEEPEDKVMDYRVDIDGEPEYVHDGASEDLGDASGQASDSYSKLESVDGAKPAESDLDGA